MMVDRRFVRQSLTRVVDKFSDQRILVIGDLMLDEYLFGSANRISEEAPVPILLVNTRDYRLGGATNTANNIKSLGGEVELIGVVGSDVKGGKFLELLRKSRIRANKVIRVKGRSTTVKTRVMAGFRNHSPQQVVRYDEEVTYPVGKKIEDKIIAYVKDGVKRVKVVIISDYDKGLLTERIIETIKGVSTGKVVIVDTKPKRLRLYKGFDWFTPNIREVEKLTGLKYDNKSDGEQLRRIAKRAIELVDSEHLLVTAGENGMYLFDAVGEFDHIPALVKSGVSDVSGAGDTVTATLGLCLSSGANPLISATISNSAAGVVVRKVGTSTVNSDELKKALTK